MRFYLMAHDENYIIPNYRDLTPEQEVEIRDNGFNRVTDTCIPENVMREIDEQRVMRAFVEAAEKDDG